MHPLAKPKAEAPCLCGSAAAWAHCCGALAAGQSPRGIIVKQDYLKPGVRLDLIKHAHRAVRKPMMQDTPAGRVRSRERVGYLVDTAAIEEQLGSLIARIFRHQTQQLAWFERPQLLAYEPGGRYITHADSDAWDAGTETWRKVADRDISLLLYLDEGFEGGALHFPRFDFRIRPRAGLLVLFPSDARYAHCAEPVTQGQRHVIVSWAAARNSPRVHARPPEDAIVFP